MSVAVREPKTSLSRVLSRAQHGEIIEVTSHNKPIACGAVSWSGGKPRHESPVAMTARGASVSQMVLKDRR